MPNPPENGAGGPDQAPDTNPKEDRHHHDQVTRDRSGWPERGCVMCELVADTRQRLRDAHRWAAFRNARGELVRFESLTRTSVSLARSLDIAGTHRAGDLL